MNGTLLEDMEFLKNDNLRQKIIDGDVDLNIVEFLYDLNGNIMIGDYLNGMQHFNIVYDDSISYKDYRKMLEEADKDLLDEEDEYDEWDLDDDEEKTFIDKFLSIFALKEKTGTKLEKLGFGEKRYFKKLAERSKKSGLKVFSLIDNRNIFKKVKDFLKRDENSYIESQEDRKYLKWAEKDRIGYGRMMENPEILDTLKNVSSTELRLLMNTQERNEAVLYHTGKNEDIYKEASSNAYTSEPNSHGEFVKDMKARAKGKEAVDKNMEATLKKITQDMGVDLPTTKNGAREDSQSNGER